MSSNENQRRQASKSGKAQRQARSKQNKKIIIFSVEIVVILLMVAGLYVIMTQTNAQGPSYTVIEPENVVTPEVAEKKESGSNMKNYMNVALFGVDATKDSQLYKNSNSDSMMIASINLKTGDIRLVSVYRDTLLNVGNDTYFKCNSAYQKGGAEQAIKMLNMNLDMDITNFVTVGYKALMEVVDGLGGVELDVDEEEMVHLNNYQKTIKADLNLDNYVPVTKTGKQRLNGLQTAAYCRIRYTLGDDFKRTERQRKVLKAIEGQAKKADAATLVKVFNNAIDDIFTSLDKNDIMKLLENIGNYRIVDEGGFPDANMRTTAKLPAKGDCVIPLDLEQNVVWLHQFFFEDENYEVTSNIHEFNDQIQALSSPYLNK